MWSKNTSGSVKNNIEIVGKNTMCYYSVLMLSDISSVVAQPIVYQHELEKRLCCVSILQETKGEGAKNENMSMVKMVTRKTVPKGCFLGGVIFSKNAYGLNGNTQDSA